MFSAERWARAYMDECAKADVKPEDGFEFFSAAVKLLEKKAVYVEGLTAAKEVDSFISEAGPEARSPAVGIARALLYLLIEKRRFRYAGLLLAELQKQIDEKNRVLNAELDAVEEPDADFIEKLRWLIAGRYRATNVNFDVKLDKSLIGGYRLRVGSELLDWSYKRQLEEMGKTLAV